MKIIVVDDESIVLGSCQRVLEEDGFEVFLVTSADETIKAIRDKEPSLLLIDLKMPNGDGIYLMKEVKKKWPYIPIMVMSGYNTAESIVEAAKMGATTFVAKPFTPDELLGAVRQVIQKEKIMGKKKALVIDDEQVVLESLKKILTDENYEVDVSLRGRQGLEWAIDKQYDIVLTDIRMPDIGGMRILREIKRAKSSLPVVMITGYATIQSAVQAMKLGATNYIEKPFTPEELIEVVNSALDRAATPEPEEQELIHKDEMIKVLERAESDNEFIAKLLSQGSEALDEYDLTGPEKLALLTGDIKWIEKYLGPLTPTQKFWLELRLKAEIW